MRLQCQHLKEKPLTCVSKDPARQPEPLWLRLSGQRGVRILEEKEDDENIHKNEIVTSIFLTFLKVEMGQHCRLTNSTPHVVMPGKVVRHTSLHAAHEGLPCILGPMF